MYWIKEYGLEKEFIGSTQYHSELEAMSKAVLICSNYGGMIVVTKLFHDGEGIIGEEVIWKYEND